MIDLDFRHVDVFSQSPFQGNGLVVVLHADTLTHEVMQTVTKEMRQFETAFLAAVDLDARSASLRIFTEDEELDFAGHPVLGAGGVLHTLLPSAQQEERWSLRVAERWIDLRTSAGTTWVDVEMDQGMPRFGRTVEGDEAAVLREAVGIGAEHVHPSLPMQVVSTGLDYLIVPVAGGLGQAQISRADVESLLAGVGAKFVYVLDPEQPEGRTWDNAGRVEDVATGSAAGPAAAYLMRYRVHPDDRSVLLHQGRFVGRPSTMRITPRPDGGLWVGGPVAPVATGTFCADVSSSTRNRNLAPGT